MRRRFLPLVVLIIGVSLLLTSICTNAAKPKLVYWAEKSFVEDFNKLTEQAAAEFGAQNGCDVEVVFLPGTDVAVRIVTAVTANAVPDMAMISSNSVIDSYEMGALADVSALYKELNGKWGGFFPGATNEVTFSGKQFAIPYGYTANMYFERRDIAQKIGVQVKKWDDFFDVNKKLKAAGIKMDALGLGVSRVPDSTEVFYPVMWSYGGSITKADGKTIAFNSLGVRRAVQMFVDWYKAGCLPADTLSWDNASNNKAYQEGTSFSICNTDSVYQWMKTNNTKLLESSYIGQWPAGPRGRFGRGSAYTFAVFKNAQNPELALKFTKYMMQDNTYLKLRRLWMLPVYKQLAEQPPWNSSYEKEIFASLQYSQPLSYPAAPSLAANRVRNAFVVMDTCLKAIVDGWSVTKAVEYGAELLKQYYPGK